MCHHQWREIDVGEGGSEIAKAATAPAAILVLYPVAGAVITMQFVTTHSVCVRSRAAVRPQGASRRTFSGEPEPAPPHRPIFEERAHHLEPIWGPIRLDNLLTGSCSPTLSRSQATERAVGVVYFARWSRA
jgi:hypothetical protein